MLALYLFISIIFYILCSIFICLQLYLIFTYFSHFCVETYSLNTTLQVSQQPTPISPLLSLVVYHYSLYFYIPYHLPQYPILFADLIPSISVYSLSQYFL